MVLRVLSLSFLLSLTTATTIRTDKAWELSGCGSPSDESILCIQSGGWALDGVLEGVGGLSRESQCQDGPGLCGTISVGATEISQPAMIASETYTEFQDESRDTIFNPEYHLERLQRDTSRSANFIDKSADPHDTSPELDVRTWTGPDDTITQTRYLSASAFATASATPDSTTATVPPGSPSKPESDTESDEGTDDLLGHTPPSRPQRSMITILLVTGCGLIGIAYLVRSPPRILRTILSKPLRFRAGEGRLVRWAEEDMGVLGEGEEDTMVNAIDDDDNDDLGLGKSGRSAEQIPLKPSPKQWRNYGSAV